jgi:D-alanyl-lipoteichoic acid acyltransferase DltB (MBOAT superfamily)
MLFNSIDFAVFLPIVFFLYWFVVNNNLKRQNLLLVAASYLFYGWWDWRFLSLILFSTCVDYFVGIGLSAQEDINKRKVLLWTSILVNLGFLCFFKYYNFFLDNFKLAFSFFGTEIESNSLNIVLPVGISFYTFQTMSYTIDVYRRKLEPTRDFVAFSAFVSFFPQLVAGPIERAANLLPQFFSKRDFEYTKAVDGLQQLLWGLFKKIVIADQCGKYANIIFDNSSEYSGSTLIVGAVLFSFQIYGDFSGYSDIAIGTSRLFGFNLMKNFAFPYFSRDIAEFWRRWHISLSSWFRDYLYIPLGGSRGDTWEKIRNTFIVFIVCGFWHGANWTFVAWGALNAVYFLPLLLLNKNRINLGVVAQGKFLPSIKEFVGMTTTFGSTVFAWIFFRADSLGHAWNYISGIFLPTLFMKPEIKPHDKTIGLIILFLIIEWLGREQEYALERLRFKLPQPLRWAVYYFFIFAIFAYVEKHQQFIYFQF